MDAAWSSQSFLALFIATSGQPADARTASQVDRFAATLSLEERREFKAWYAARTFFNASMDAYWAKVESKRRQRRRKRSRTRAFGRSDYVTTLPPKYKGPGLKKSLARRWSAFRARERKPGKRRRTLPGVSDYLRAAKRYYNFAPDRIPEDEYKRRYAREALSYGLTKRQVVRIFALETGGNGTADMQAGINPRTKKGRPISSALGYAQLLAANSVNVLSKHGTKFQARLARMISKTRSPARRKRLQHKLNVLRAMIRTAKSVPYKWSRHIALARTGRGMGLHVMNIDGDIGPWMQVVKIADLKRMAARRGLTNLAGNEIELMNLAGPATGLEMMRTVGRRMPTANFFSRRAYYRNTIVRGRTAQGLLGALDTRMDQNSKNDGAQMFIKIFDELNRTRARVVPPVPTRVKAGQY